MNKAPDNMAPDHAFDARMRQHHAQALAQVSSRTLAQLQLRPHAAAAPPTQHFPSLRAMAWPLATACAVGVLAIGLQWRQSDPASSPANPPVAAVSTDELLSVYAAFDEAPDLYLWLASNDAAALAME